MSLTLSAYQERAKATDLKPEGPDGLVIALLGLVGEAGSLLTEYKKRMVDGEAHQGFKAHLAEELGDLLWYLATIATRNGLSLEDAAHQKPRKKPWAVASARPLSCAALRREAGARTNSCPGSSSTATRSRDVGWQGGKVVTGRRRTGNIVGDPLTDNAHEDDGYRFHDVLHLGPRSCSGLVARSQEVTGPKAQIERRRRPC